MVANAMFMAVAIHAGKSGSQNVYHVGSSCKNPITFGQLHDLAARYFTKSPLVGRDGSPIIVSKGTILSTMAQFSFYMTLRYKLPLQVWFALISLNNTNFNSNTARQILLSSGYHVTLRRLGEKIMKIEKFY